MSHNPDKSVNKASIKLFWHHATRYKRHYLPVVFLVPFNILISDFMLPFITAEVLRKISTGSYDKAHLWHSFGPQISLYALGAFVSLVIGWRLVIWTYWSAELRVTRDIAHRIFVHLMNMSAGFHANRFGGSLVSQANKLTGAYVRFVDASTFEMYPLIISSLAAITILAPRVPLYSVALAVLTITYVVGTIVFSKPVREANRIESEQQSKQTGNLADSISNVMAVKSFARSDYEQARYWKSASKTRTAGIKSMRTTTVREIYTSFVSSSISVIALVIAIFGVGLLNVDIGTLFLIVSYTAAIGHRLWEFQNVLRQYNRALGDASDMVKILQIEPEIKDPSQPDNVRFVRGQIDIKDLTFSHPDSRGPLFKKLNLRIKAGEKIGLVGHSGSGKTTLTRLLLRFSDIDSGAILMDGQDIRSVTQDDLRRHISYVPQEPLLFHRSLAENISYGRPEATQQEIEAIAKMANAYEFITDLPDKYETLVGERGVKLSGGQRQRIAIARAMLKNAPILLLDEATSALDSESEGLIQDALWKLMEGRTTIAIAHRLSTIQRMDRIIVLDDGKIVEEGSHKELVKANGPYARMWAHQSGGFLEENGDES